MEKVSKYKSRENHGRFGENGLNNSSICKSKKAHIQYFKVIPGVAGFETDFLQIWSHNWERVLNFTQKLYKQKENNKTNK